MQNSYLVYLGSFSRFSLQLIKIISNKLTPDFVQYR